MLFQGSIVDAVTEPLHDPMQALPDDVEAPDPYAEMAPVPQDEVQYDGPMARSLLAPIMQTAPRNSTQVVAIALARVFNRPGYCQQECRLVAEIPPLWPNASTAARNAVGVKPGIGPGGAFAYWTGGAEGDGHVAYFLPNGLIRSTDAAGSGRWGTRTLEWFNTNWSSLDYMGWADNNNNYRVPGVQGDWFDMATKAELAAIIDPRFAALNLRIDGLVERQQKILEGLEAIDLELDGAASREQASKIRLQVREVKNLVLALSP
jgi:hypothetical protein